MTKRAVIIGGGIAGTLAGIALQRVGVDAVVHEAYGAESDGVGSFLTLAVNGLTALEPLGLSEAVGALGMQTRQMHLISGRTGRQLGATGMRARTLTRSQLYRTLRVAAAERGVEVQYGKRFVDAVRTSSGVTARFEDGTSATGDLLIGADGLRSRTRTVIDPAAPAARHIGLLNTGGRTDAAVGGAVLDAPSGDAHFVFGRRCFFGWLRHPDGSVWWFANPAARHEPSREELAAIDPGQWRRRLNDLFSQDEGPMLEIIAATDEIARPWNTYDFPRVPTWHDDRMIIIGDAAHATSPSAGQGASMAIEDAVVLAMCLRDVPQIDQAFAAFEQHRRRRVERVVAQGRRNGSGKAAGPIGARIRDAVLPTVVRRYATPEALAWIYEHRIDWDARITARS